MCILLLNISLSILSSWCYFKWECFLYFWIVWRYNFLCVLGHMVFNNSKGIHTHACLLTLGALYIDFIFCEQHLLIGNHICLWLLGFVFWSHFARIKQFIRCEYDPSAEWNSWAVGEKLLMEVTLWNFSLVAEGAVVPCSGSSEILTEYVNIWYQSLM